MRSFSKTPFSSISLTRGRTFSSANWRMLSRKRISSSVKLVSGVGDGSWRTSGIQAPSIEYDEPRILASLGRGFGGAGILPPQCGPDAPRQPPGRRRYEGSALLVDEFQAVGLHDALDLIAGVNRPRTRGIQFHVSPPVLQRLAGL